MEADFYIVTTTVVNESQAVDLARRIVENRLGRCVQIIPRIRSIYHWDGEICDEDECLLFIKLPACNLDQLIRRLTEWHPYEMPEIVSVPVSSGLTAYLKWLDDWRYNDGS
ncbi:divalent-cation tolerance protein CutA [bacterium]|nr:divalent-cation tolerance protein CutA [candidate division CSSED10-310 bacterium]